jgi:peptidoglycan hydrolase CwlO-like protein
MIFLRNQNKIRKTISTAILAIFLIVFLFPKAIYASTSSDLQNQINNLNQQIKQQQDLLNQKAQESKSLANQVAVLNGQISEIQLSMQKTQNQIVLTQNDITSLKQQIVQKEKDLAYQKSVLNQDLRVIYEESDTSLVETIFSSSNISQVIDRTTYLSAIQEKISGTMAQITQIKTALAQSQADQEQKVASLTDQKNQLTEQKNSLASSQASYSRLLSQTQGQEANYQAMISSLQKDKSGAQQALSRSNSGGGSGGNVSGGGTGGYPSYWASAPIDSIIDDWGFWNRECVSYASWYWNDKLGKKWYNTQPGMGSAKYWGQIAATLGYSVSSTPQVNAIAMWPYLGGYGHVAIVTAVNSSNNTFSVSEYNYTPASYDERSNIPINSSVYFIY